MAKFYFPNPRETPELADNYQQKLPTKKPSNWIVFFFYLIALVQLLTGLVAAVLVFFSDRQFNTDNDLRVNYYAQTTMPVWIYAIVALASVPVFTYLAGKLLTGNKRILLISIAFLLCSTFILVNLYWKAFLAGPLLLPDLKYISQIKLSLSPWVIVLNIVLASLSLLVLLLNYRRFGFPDAPPGDRTKGFFYLFTLLAMIPAIYVAYSLFNGFSADYGYGTINALGRFRLYHTPGEVVGLLPVNKLHELVKPIAQREHAVTIDYGTPLDDITTEKQLYTTKASLTMVGFPDNLDLLNFVNSLPKTTLNAKPCSPILASRRSRYGYLIENKGTQTLVLVTEDNVLIMVSSSYLSEAQIIDFADSLQ